MSFKVVCRCGYISDPVSHKKTADSALRFHLSGHLPRHYEGRIEEDDNGDGKNGKRRQ